MGTARWLASLALLGACGSDGGSPPAKWELITQDQPAALLSVWANSASNVWVVGGHGATGGPIIVHYDGTTWSRFATTGYDNVNLWWVTGFDDGRIFMGGDQGTILSTTDGSSFTKLDPPAGTGNVTVFGIWGAASNDVWAVGGTGAGGGFLWRYDGTTWSAFSAIPSEIANGTCWKVNGHGSNDVWMSATNGTVLHWHDGVLDTMALPDPDQQQYSLFSIGASTTRVVTVGGSTTGVLYDSDGTGNWTAPLGSIGVLLSGVAVSGDEAYAVGGGGTILHSASAGKWTADRQTLTIESLHAAFIDPTGDVWTVGGNFNSTPMSGGVLLHKGAALQGSFP
jgi:photosystem II stability/assembly factor-like uncharacterized protein